MAITPDGVDLLTQYPWPGNIRELETPPYSPSASPYCRSFFTRVEWSTPNARAAVCLSWRTPG